MNNKTKNIVVTITFIALMLFFVISCTVKHFNPTEFDYDERKTPAKFPQNITWQSIINTKDKNASTIKQFESYTVEQFPYRKFFRSLKAHFQYDVFNLKENNGLAIENGYIAKIEPSFSVNAVEHSISRIKYTYEKFIKDKCENVYISVIPDKNYFFGKEFGYPTPDYAWLTDSIQNSFPDMKYIDLFGSLELSDYYRTDTHWSQDKILGALDKLATEMGVADRLSGSYKENVLEGFRGVYHGQSALSLELDTMVYLTNDMLDACTMFDYETMKTAGLYNTEAFYGVEGYDLFLAGTMKSLLRLDNPNATTDDELVIFRDSFGSSIAPLFCEAYKTVYVVDTRYILPDMVNMKIDFEGKDVLFLYSSLVLNSTEIK